MRANGTVVVTEDKDNGYRQCDVQNWKLFNNFDILEQEQAETKAHWEAERRRKEEEAEEERQRKEAAERRRLEAERVEAESKRLEEIACKKIALEAEQGELLAELVSFKGLFTRRRRREIETRLTEIRQELQRVSL